MNNILVVNVNWLGDAVFSLPVFAALRNTYPQANIVCLCVARVADVLQYCGDINQIIVLDEKKAHFWPWQKFGLMMDLRSRNFDAAFVLHRSLSRTLMVWCAGIPQRIGFSKWPWLMTRHVANIPGNVHRMDHYLKVIEAFGITPLSRVYALNPPQDHSGIPGEYIVFNTGGNWDLKQWPLPLWVDLARIFKSKGMRVVFTGAQKDRVTAQAIIDQTRVDAVNLCGETTLGQSLSVYAKAKVVISADSGPLHLAGSVGAPVIGLFGPTRPEITGPRGIGKNRVLLRNIGCNKKPCYHLACSNNVCMKGISASDVWDVYEEFIG